MKNLKERDSQFHKIIERRNAVEKELNFLASEIFNYYPENAELSIIMRATPCESGRILQRYELVLKVEI